MDFMNYNNKKIIGGFSLAEALITLLIISIVALATVPVITKKRKKIENVRRNSFACYWNGGNIVGKYNLNGEIKAAETITETVSDGITRSGCKFDPPSNAKNFVVTTVGGGGGGAAGKAREENFASGGQSSGEYTIPADGIYEILLMGAGGAGGHTSSGQVGHIYGSSQAPGTSGSPAGLVVSKEIKLDKNGKLNYNIGVQGWAREENDGVAQEGQEATLSYNGMDSDGRAQRFFLGAQGGGGGASMNYDGKDRSHFYQCAYEFGGTQCVKEVFKGTDIVPTAEEYDRLEAGLTVQKTITKTPSATAENPNPSPVQEVVTFSSVDDLENSPNCDWSNPDFLVPGGFKTRAEDKCLPTLDGGYYPRNVTTKKGNSQSRPYIRSGHSGGVKIKNLSGRFTTNDFTKYVETKSDGWASIYEFEKPGAWRCLTATSTGCTTRTTQAAHSQHNNARPYRNDAMTPELMIKFKIWASEDQNHPWGSGGYGTGGGMRNHRDPVGNGGAGVFAMVWKRSYSGLGGQAGEVLQIPFAQLPKGTVCFPGKGGKGGLGGHYGGYDGQASFLKNYPSASGGQGAPEIDYNNANTYYKSIAGNKAEGKNGELANINPVAKQEGGAGGFTSLEQNGYIDNTANLNGLTREIFKNGIAIGLFTDLFGAGAGGGGGSAWTDVWGQGGDGSSGIIFIQW